MSTEKPDIIDFGKTFTGIQSLVLALLQRNGGSVKISSAEIEASVVLSKPSLYRVRTDYDETHDEITFTVEKKPDNPQENSNG